MTIFNHPSHNFPCRFFDFRRETLAGVKIFSLNAINNEMRWQLVQRARQLDGFGDTEGVRGIMEELGWNGLFACIKTINRSRSGTGVDGIDEYDRLRIFPLFHQCRSFAVLLEHFAMVEGPLLQVASDDQPYRIVMAIFVANADDEVVAFTI